LTDSDDEFAGDLRTTYVSNLGSGVHPDEEDFVLGVIRYKYDFVERTVDRNCPALAPPKNLLRHYKNAEENAASDDDILDPDRVAWHTVSFRDRYLGYLERPGPQACIEGLRDRLDDGQTVWLVCLEKDDTFCHRRLLEARIHGSSPTHWSELHGIPEPESDDDDGATSPTLGDFAGGETA
jgi:hypothetical protein